MLSIIVPVYNSENYLEECLESLVLQDFKDFEVILVDDGSTDRSLDICSRYSDRYSNIKVFHQENKGVSSARQNGLEKAEGDWIIFVDSDDFVEKNMCNIINESIYETNCDVIVFDKGFNEKYFYKGNKSELVKGILGFEAKFDLNNRKLFSVCSKAYNKDFLSKNKAVFEHNLFNGEDMIFNINVFTKANSIKFVDEEFYYYRKNISSITHSYNKKILKNDEYFLKKLNDICKEVFDNTESKIIYNETVLNGLFICIRRYFANSKNENNILAKRKELQNYLLKKPYYEGLKSFQYLYSKLSIKKKIILLLLKYRMIIPVLIICKN
ncbi:MAG: glycosyltransferase [Clostridium sp.]|jgi:glycosyltransferase involved in cell wall biosynthesis|nr:glycosyltransferase [Clostridium sp.]